MGVTSSGLRYPEPTEPVNQGATAMRNLAEDVTVRGPVIIGSPTTLAVTLQPSPGMNGFTSVFTVPAAPYARVLMHVLCGFVTTLTAGSTALFYLRKNGTTDVRRIQSKDFGETNETTFIDTLAANTTATYQGVAQVTTGSGTVPADNRLAYLNIYSLGPYVP